MSREIEDLKNELKKLKSRLHFWKTIALILLMDIPLITAMVLGIIGIGEMNSVDADFYYVRYSQAIYVFSSFIIMVVVNLYLVCKDEG